MHAKAGVNEKNMKLAVVFHSKGAFDLTRASYYGEKYDNAENANAVIIKALLEKTSASSSAVKRPPITGLKMRTCSPA